MRPYQRVLAAWAVGVFVFGLWCSRLITVPEYYQRGLALGWYPLKGDPISSSIAWGDMLTVLGAPFWILALWLGLRRFPPRVQLLAWSDDCIGSTLLWTAASAIFCYFKISDLIEAVQLRLPLTGTAALLWIAAWLLLRAILISRAADIAHKRQTGQLAQ